jgi:hypothetical protein
MRAALQLHMTAPSSPLSHSASDLHLPELFISLQSVVPMQAHLTPSPGVWKVKLSPGAHTHSERRHRKSQNEKGSLHIAPLSNSTILTYELSDIVAEDHASTSLRVPSPRKSRRSKRTLAWPRSGSKTHIFQSFLRDGQHFVDATPV